MPITRATVVLNKRSNVSEDAARNVWHFATNDVASGTLAQIGASLGTFYDSIATLLSPAVSNTGHRVEFATVNVGNPGEADDVVSPLVGTTSFIMNNATTQGGGIPNEVAVCLSFRADITGVPEEQGVNRPRARRRGRLFLGPVKSTVFESLAPSYEPAITVAARELILDAYDVAHAAWRASALDAIHVVYSRKDGLTRNVREISVDNEPDTQRRRGRRPSVRMVRAIDPVAPAVGNRTGVDVALAS